MRNRMKTGTWFGLSAAAIVWLVQACQGTEPAAPLPQRVLAEFSGRVEDGAVVFEKMAVARLVDGKLSQELIEIPVVGDGIAGSGPADTIEFVTEYTGRQGASCARNASFCGDVRLRSFFGGNELRGVFVELTSVTPVVNEAFGDTPAAFGLDSTIGLWSYGNIAANDSAVRTWKFNEPNGTNFAFFGHVVAEVQPNAAPAENCAAGGDEDGDGLSNCDDPECATQDPCRVETCGNLVDDDGDGLIDCADGDCSADANHCPLACPADSAGSSVGTNILSGRTVGGPRALDASCGDGAGSEATIGWTAPATGRFRAHLADGQADFMLSVHAASCGGELSDAGASTCSVDRRAFTGTFSGGDAGEGLDTRGTFPYAVNVRGPAAGAVGDATFTNDVAAGVTVTAQNEVINWHAPNYGASTNDNNLEVVMQSIRWSLMPGDLNVDLTGLTVGRHYKLQLLFAEGCCDRGFDIYVEGVLAVDNFSSNALQGGINVTTVGAKAVIEFWAQDTTLNIVLDQPAPPTDNNPMLSGFTLEERPGVEFEATMGTTYTFVVDSAAGDEGFFDLSVDAL